MNRVSAAVVSCMLTFALTAQVGIKEMMKRGTYNAVARMRVVLRCIDQDGRAVPNVTISSGVTLDGNPETTTQIKGRTDNDGCFVVEGKGNGELGYLCSKDGFYETREIKWLFQNPAVTVSSGRWQPYGMTNTVVLKRKVNPVAMYVHRGDIDRLKLPKLDDWTGFDLERADWVYPHGNGKLEDFQVFFRRGETNHMGAFRQFALTFRFCKPFDGVYLSRKDNTGSQFKCIYEADTNRNYETEIQFTYERQTDPASGRVVYKNKLLREEEYLVLRVRSEINEEGQLIKAHYAKICTPLFAARARPASATPEVLKMATR